MQILNEKIKRTTLQLMKEIPDVVTICPRNSAIFHVKNKNNIMRGACIKCDNPFCIYLNSDDIKSDSVKEFPEDRDTRVCPVGAISWDENLEVPVIDDSKCIHCGLCARQCPVGAIYYSNDKINICYESEGYENVPYNLNSVKLQNIQIDQIRKAKRNGYFIDETNQIMEDIYNRIRKSSLLPEKFIRNVMVGLGCKCATRRIGDVYVRMDAIYNTPEGTFGAIEVEFGSDTLSASRGILDDIAVLHSRYNIYKHSNNALVVCLSLPNMRQGYWQVVKDISVVENIRINTLTCGAMLILLWNQLYLDLGITSFYADYDSPTIRESLNNILGRNVMISDKVLGILEPLK